MLQEIKDRLMQLIKDWENEQPRFGDEYHHGVVAGYCEAAAELRSFLGLPPTE